MIINKDLCRVYGVERRSSNFLFSQLSCFIHYDGGKLVNFTNIIYDLICLSKTQNENNTQTLAKAAENFHANDPYIFFMWKGILIFYRNIFLGPSMRERTNERRCP